MATLLAAVGLAYLAERTGLFGRLTQAARGNGFDVEDFLADVRSAVRFGAQKTPGE